MMTRFEMMKAVEECRTQYAHMMSLSTSASRGRNGRILIKFIEETPELGHYVVIHEHRRDWANRIQFDEKLINTLNTPFPYESDDDTRGMHLPYEFDRVTGLYFLGMVNVNPMTNEIFYWVKVGYASNILSRMRNYNSHCPMLWHIDYTGETNEEYYHQQLRKVALATCNHNDEWFMVDRETYLAMCDKGFRYFE